MGLDSLFYSGVFVAGLEDSIEYCVVSIKSHLCVMSSSSSVAFAFSKPFYFEFDHL